MTPHQRYVHKVLSKLATNEWMTAQALLALQSVGCNPDAGKLIDALEYMAEIDAYSDPRYDDGSGPIGRTWNRAEHNRMMRDNAGRQLDACIAALSRTVEVSAA